MSQPLEEFYDRELSFLEEIGALFAQRYPTQAKRLVLDKDANVDPHLDRFIEGFALLGGRIQHKLDSDFPELTESLLGVMYPHLGLVIPPMSIAHVEPRRPLPTLHEGMTFPQHTAVHSREIGGEMVRCQYQFGYPLTVWPIQIRKASWQIPPLYGLKPPAGTVAALRLELVATQGAKFSQMPLEQLRLYLSGQLAPNLYDAIFHRCLRVDFRPLDGPTGTRTLSLSPDDCLKPVGFNLDEGLLPFPKESFLGYRLLMEFFSFPQKFLFVDLDGFGKARTEGFASEMEVVLYFNASSDNLERGFSEKNLLLGCTPIINLFEKSADPVDFHQRQTEYRVVPQRRAQRSLEVYRVEGVTCFDPNARQYREFRPFFGYDFYPTEEGVGYWYASRRASSIEHDTGTEVFLHLVDSAFDPRQPSEAVLAVDTLCTNRNLPNTFQSDGEDLYFHKDGWTADYHVRLFQKPTSALRPPMRRSAHWRLLGQNCLNQLSLANPREGKMALQELLRLCNFNPGPETNQLIEGIASVASKPMLARTDSSQNVGFCRGTQLQLTFDEQKYIGTGVFLFASVLERFFGLYTGMNSFVQFIARTTQAQGNFHKWPPRAADRPLH